MKSIKMFLASSKDRVSGEDSRLSTRYGRSMDNEIAPNDTDLCLLILSLIF